VKIFGDPSLVELGDGHRIDEDVLLGYPTGRRINSLKLTLGPGAVIRSGSVIYAGSTIGARLETGHGVVIREQNIIGDGLQVWNHTTIDYGCRLGRNVHLHTNCYIAQFTTLEDEVFVAPGVTIANDLHPGRAYSKELMRGPTLRRGAQLGVNVTVAPYVEIGAGALIGAGSVVTRDIPAGMLAYGNPARPVRPVAELNESELQRVRERSEH
jgi:acetyltransferase-like isoleucine patch superfamily enzyme